MQITCPNCETSYQVDPSSVGETGRSVRCARCRTVWFAANTAAHAFTLAQHEGIALGDAVARAGQQTATELVTGRDIAIEIVVFDREGTLVGRAPFEN